MEIGIGSFVACSTEWHLPEDCQPRWKHRPKQKAVLGEVTVVRYSRDGSKKDRLTVEVFYPACLAGEKVGTSRGESISLDRLPQDHEAALSKALKIFLAREQLARSAVRPHFLQVADNHVAEFSQR